MGGGRELDGPMVRRDDGGSENPGLLTTSFMDAPKPGALNFPALM